MRRYKVVVCGTAYGQVYLSSFLCNSRFTLAGIMGKGSDRTKLFAREFGVPFYHSVKEIPETVDIACVAIRSTIAGGEGSFIARELLEKGIHVIQEHPLHGRDIVESLSVASRKGVCFHVNSHYVNVEPIRTFIDYAKKMGEHGTPLYIEATAAPQTTYSLLDIIARILGGIGDYAYTPPIPWKPACVQAHQHKLFPFLCLQGVLQGIPVTFHLQNYIDSTQFDNHYLAMHRITVGSESGSINLLNTHGPVVWADSFSIEENIRETSFRNRKSAFLEYKKPTAVTFTPQLAPSLAEISRRAWPAAVTKALNEMAGHIESGAPPYGQTEKYLEGLSTAWLDLTKVIGDTADLKLSCAPSAFPDPLEYFHAIHDNGVKRNGRK